MFVRKIYNEYALYACGVVSRFFFCSLSSAISEGWRFFFLFWVCIDFFLCLIFSPLMSAHVFLILHLFNPFAMNWIRVEISTGWLCMVGATNNCHYHVHDRYHEIAMHRLCFRNDCETQFQKRRKGEKAIAILTNCNNNLWNYLSILRASHLADMPVN